MPKTIFLVPGYGTQGGGAKDVVPCFNSDGRGAIVNNSRGIIAAHQKKYKELGDDKFDQAARQAAIDMKEDITKALREAGKWRW